jgi:type II secretory ATPase GspE/PulE/Tfp pilus assembly ATPase PilB-like protein
VIFGFGRKDASEQDHEDEKEDVDFVLFQGALNGKQANLNANARLAQAGLIPTKELITDAILRRADQIRLEPKGDRTLVQLSIDGVAYPASRLSKQQGHAVTQMVKLLSGLDVQQRQRPQSGGVRAELKGTKYELRVASTPVAEGTERLSVKIKNLDQAPRSAEEVGFSKQTKAKVRDLTSEKKGIVLVCGPPGSGVSTTVFGVLRCVDAYQFTAFTIGDRQGWELPNINDFPVEDGEDLDATLARALRAEADVVYTGPIRDAETVKALIKLSPDTCLVAEIQAADAIQGALQFAKLAGDPSAAVEALSAVMSQRLLRALCNDCRMAYRPNPKMLAKIGLPPETRTLYRAATPGAQKEGEGEVESAPACEKCGGTGYLGRVAMFEILEMSAAIRKLVAAGAGPGDIKAEARKEKMQTLQQEGLRLVIEGKTSLEELQRIFRPK